MRLESWISIDPRVDKSNLLCVGHDCSTSKADIVEGEISKSSTMLWFWAALACGLKADFWRTPLAGGLITRSVLGFLIWSGLETKGDVAGVELESSTSLPVTRFLLP